MDNVLVSVGLMAVILVLALLVPPLRIRAPNTTKLVSIPPPLPSDARGDATTIEAKDISVPESELEEIDEAAKAKARDLVSKSAVDSAACDVLGMAQNWPKVLEANSGQLSLPFRAMTEGRMPAEHVGARDGRWVNWSSNGIAYRLELWVDPNNAGVFEDDLQIGDLQLWVDGQLVMHLGVLKRTETQHDRWAPFDVRSLRAGSWMLRLNELAAYLRISDERRAKGSKKADPQETLFGRSTPPSVTLGADDE
jgi:hypothetical protein